MRPEAGGNSMREHPVSVARSRRDVFRYAAVSAVGLALPATVSAASGPLSSAGVLTFGPNNVLFVGDIKGAKIHALAFRDKRHLFGSRNPVFPLVGRPAHHRDTLRHCNF